MIALELPHPFFSSELFQKSLARGVKLADGVSIDDPVFYSCFHLFEHHCCYSGWEDVCLPGFPLRPRCFNSLKEVFDYLNLIPDPGVRNVKFQGFGLMLFAFEKDIQLMSLMPECD